MGPTPFEFVGNPTPLGEAAPRGGGETAPRKIVFSDAERFQLLRRAPAADHDFSVTLIFTVTLLFWLCTVMITLPFFLAVTTPLPETEATLFLSEE